jgi:hypothetical protein
MALRGDGHSSVVSPRDWALELIRRPELDQRRRERLFDALPDTVE